MRELLSKYEFPGDKTPMVIGSALKALEGEDSRSGDEVDPEAGRGAGCLHPDAQARDRQAVPDAGGGRVLDLGTGHGGDRAHRARASSRWAMRSRSWGSSPRRRRCARAWRCSGSCWMRARRATTWASCCGAPSAKRSSAARCWPSPAASPRTRSSSARCTCCRKEEGGRHTPFFNNYRPQFYFRTTDVTGAVELPKGTEMVMPGDNVKMVVTLITPDRDGAGPALRHPRGRQDRRRRRRRQDHRVVPVNGAQGHSSIGRASVSKTEGWGFETLCPCHERMSEALTTR